MKKFLSFITAAAMLTAGLPANAVAEETVTYAPVLISEANFPDPAFRQHLLDKIDTDGSGFIDGQEQAGLYLNMRKSYVSNITSVKGIELLPGLMGLQLDNQSGLTEIDVSCNPKLEVLILYDTGITSIDVSKNTILKVLNLEATDINSIDVSKCHELQTLDVSNTAITSLDVSNNPSMMYMYLNKTGVSSIDLRNCTKLDVFECSRTAVSNIDFSNNPLIHDLDISYTGITSLDLSQFKQMIRLDVGGLTLDKLDFSYATDIQTLSMSTVGSFDMSPLTELWELDLTDSEMTGINLSAVPGVTHLTAYRTAFEKFDASPCTNLEWCCVGGDNLTEVNVTGCGGLTRLDIDAPITSLDLSNKSELEELYISSDTITDMNLSSCPKLKYIVFECGKLKSLDLSKNTELKHLNLKKCGIGYLNLDSNLNIDKTNFYNTAPADLTYTGNSIDLAELYGDDFDISRIVIVENCIINGTVLESTDSESPKYTYYTGNDAADLLTVTMNPRYVNLTEENFEIDAEEYTYTGEAFEPRVQMKFGDCYYSRYKVEYHDNVNAGIATAVITGDSYENDSTKFLGSVEFNFIINKAIPEYTVPTGLKGNVGTSLQSIELPEGFSWDESDVLLSSAGKMVCTATYTPEDAVNYETISGIEVEVEVMDGRGDVNLDGVVDVADSVLILTYYASANAGIKYKFHDNLPDNVRANTAADVDEDGVITVDDAQYVLAYYARFNAGMNSQWNDIIK